MFEEEFPNVLVIPDNDEQPEDLVQRYGDILAYNIKRGVSTEEVLWMFFEDISVWAQKQYHIASARQSLQNLEDIHMFENGLLLDIDDDFDGDE